MKTLSGESHCSARETDVGCTRCQKLFTVIFFLKSIRSSWGSCRIPSDQSSLTAQNNRMSCTLYLFFHLRFIKPEKSELLLSRWRVSRLSVCRILSWPPASISWARLTTVAHSVPPFIVIVWSYWGVGPIRWGAAMAVQLPITVACSHV